jgi:hypothetical protein
MPYSRYNNHYLAPPSTAYHMRSASDPSPSTRSVDNTVRGAPASVRFTDQSGGGTLYPPVFDRTPSPGSGGDNAGGYFNSQRSSDHDAHPYRSSPTNQPRRVSFTDEQPAVSGSSAGPYYFKRYRSLKAGEELRRCEVADSAGCPGSTRWRAQAVYERPGPSSRPGDGSAPKTQTDDTVRSICVPVSVCNKHL